MRKPHLWNSAQRHVASSAPHSLSILYTSNKWDCRTDVATPAAQQRQHSEGHYNPTNTKDLSCVLPILYTSNKRDCRTDGAAPAAQQRHSEAPEVVAAPAAAAVMRSAPSCHRVGCSSCFCCCYDRCCCLAKLLSSSVLNCSCQTARCRPLLNGVRNSCCLLPATRGCVQYSLHYMNLP
jgi:hypothetical protein